MCFRVKKDFGDTYIETKKKGLFIPTSLGNKSK